MALAYTAPTWTNGSGTGISASQLQAISDCIEGLVQGTDKAVHSIEINGSTITLTFADGSTESTTATNLKGIALIEKTGTSGLVDTYTITYTDGSTSTFTVTNGSAPNITVTATADSTSSDNPTVTVTKTGTSAAPNYAMAFSGLKGAQGEQGPTGADGDDGVSPGVTITTITGGHRVTITDADHPSGQTFDVMDGTGSGDMQASDYDANSAVKTAGGIAAYVSGQISGKADDSDLDDWTATATVSSGSVTFTGLSDSYAYWPYAEDTFCHITGMTKTGSGSNVTLVYTTDAADNTVVKLRILK